MSVFKVVLTGFEKSPCYTSDISGIQNIVEAYFGANMEWADMNMGIPLMTISIEEIGEDEFNSLNMHEIFD